MRIAGDNRKYFNANCSRETIENKYPAVLEQLEKEKNA